MNESFKTFSNITRNAMKNNTILLNLWSYTDGKKILIHSAKVGMTIDKHLALSINRTNFKFDEWKDKEFFNFHQIPIL